MKWSGREDLVLGRTLEPLVVIINMYKNRHGTIPILVSMFGGCGEPYLEDLLVLWLYLVKTQVNEVEQ
jgi:hypothetical protein